MLWDAFLWASTIPIPKQPPKQQQLQTPYTTHKTTINGCMVIIYGHQFAISHTVRSARENDIEAHAMGIWFWLRHIYKFKTRRQCPYHHKMVNASLCVVCVSCVCRPQRQEFANGQRSPSYTSRTSSLGKIFLIAITLVALFFSIYVWVPNMKTPPSLPVSCGQTIIQKFIYFIYTSRQVEVVFIYIYICINTGMSQI